MACDFFPWETALSSVGGFAALHLAHVQKWCLLLQRQVPAELLEKHQRCVGLSEGLRLTDMPISSLLFCVCFCWGNIAGGVGGCGVL